MNDGLHFHFRTCLVQRQRDAGYKIEEAGAGEIMTHGSWITALGSFSERETEYSGPVYPFTRLMKYPTICFLLRSECLSIQGRVLKDNRRIPVISRILAELLPLICLVASSLLNIGAEEVLPSLRDGREGFLFI